MYKKLLSTLLIATGLFTATAYSQEEADYLPYGYNNDQETSCRQDFTYIKLGGGFAGTRTDLAPGVTFGKRFDRDGVSAIDISMNFVGNNQCLSYSIPKIVYLRYFSLSSDTSFYYGGGLSYGGNAGKTKYHFSGIQGELVGGYEFNRTQSIRTFIELTMSQGIIPFNTKRKYAFNPATSLGFGVGF